MGRWTGIAEVAPDGGARATESAPSAPWSRSLLAVACVPAAPTDPSTENPPEPALATGGPAALVNPFIGTAPAASSSPVPGGTTGDTFPGATVPFGAVQWSPDTPRAENPAGYAWSDSTIDGFSLTHFSGAGCPNSGLVRFVPGTDGRAEDAVAFTHDDETARPGSYEVTLDDGVRVELSATTRAGIGRFSFPSGATPTIAIDNGVRHNTFPLLDLPTLRAVDDRTIVGTAVGGGFCGTPTSFRMHFVVEFSRSFTVASYDPLHRVALRFDGAAGANVIARTGVSWVSDDGARANLAAEVPGWSYGEVRNAAYEQWNAMLGRLSVGGGTETQQRTFTTALYHSLLHPNVASDVDGRYLGFDGYVHTTSPGTVHFANFSGWDIYRSQVQLIALLAPDVAKDLSQSLLDDALQCGGGFPKWTLANQEALVMIGDPGALMVSNLDAFGAGGDDVAGVLEVMRRSADEPGTTCGYRTLRPALGSYLSRGYTPTLPASVEGDVARYVLGVLFDTADASTTLEYAVADTAIGQYAARHGDAELASRLCTGGRGGSTSSIPRPGTCAPGSSTGRSPPISTPPRRSGSPRVTPPQYTWMVPQDYTRLVELLGGPTEATARLDSLFEEVNAGITRSLLLHRQRTAVPRPLGLRLGRRAGSHPGRRTPRHRRRVRRHNGRAARQRRPRRYLLVAGVGLDRHVPRGARPGRPHTQHPALPHRRHRRAGSGSDPGARRRRPRQPLRGRCHPGRCAATSGRGSASPTWSAARRWRMRPRTHPARGDPGRGSRRRRSDREVRTLVALTLPARAGPR